MTAPDLSRRSVLSLGACLGVTFLAAPVLASAARQPKFAVIICRGAMDGLSVMPPVGDPDYLALRGAIAIPADKALKLDADFGLHPKLGTLYELAQAGQARLAPAAAIPRRIRSHFEAQDMLESGGDELYGLTSGWLNRALTALAPDRKVAAISIGPREPLILRGPAPVQSWSPGGRGTQDIARVVTALQDLYKSDPVLSAALASGLQTEAAAKTLNDGAAPAVHDVKGLASTAGRFLAAEGGPSIAVLSLDGFDTHAGQGAVSGQLANRLAALDEVIAGLRDGLGTAWTQTVIVAVTEFGRTVHVNGTGGTDHGTASTMIIAGGALKPGGIVGDWPTLKRGALFENRDLAPALDVRQVFKGILRDHLAVEPAVLDATVFPDSREASPLSDLV